MTLQRHNTAPASSAGHSVIAPVSVGRRLSRGTSFSAGGYRSFITSMKSNPYVGAFRHSPPTSRLSENRKTIINLNDLPPWHWVSVVPVSLKACKNSPHIGFMRHSPPSRLSDLVATVSCNSHTPQGDQIMPAKLLNQLTKGTSMSKISCRDEPIDVIKQTYQQVVFSGRLLGGGKDYLERSRSCRKEMHRVSSSAAEGTLSTVDTLSSLAAWFLFPLAHDAESCGYPDSRVSTRKQHKKRRSKEEGLLSQLSPYLSTCKEKPHRSISKKDRKSCSNKVARKTKERDDSESSNSDFLPPAMIIGPSTPSCNDDDSNSDLSVSSLGEACYTAHQMTKCSKDDENLTPELPAAAALDPNSLSPHRLDYVITQMDVARMARNAARHLDVQSILGLPVITYQGGPPITKRPSPASRSGGWSWTIVEETEGQKESSRTMEETIKDSHDAEVCVICLEHFVPGDRLRVLPCDHSFHIGCIDRWLLGTQSFHDCCTSGCPTCKKHPTAEGTTAGNDLPPRSRVLSEPISTNAREEKDRSASLDGSVPSFAFAQLGSVLFAQQEEQSSVSS